MVGNVVVAERQAYRKEVKRMSAQCAMTDYDAVQPFYFPLGPGVNIFCFPTRAWHLRAQHNTCGAVSRVDLLFQLKWGFGLAGVSCLPGSNFRRTPAAGRKDKLIYKSFLLGSREQKVQLLTRICKQQ
jgi:hypothetical protein